MRLGSCHELILRPLTGTWYRAINQKHWKTRLSTKHTTTVTSRYSAGSAQNPAYQVLYLAQNHQLALFEVEALLGNPTNPIANPAATWTILALNVSLASVADLVDPGQQRLIGTYAQELTGSWLGYGRTGTAPTQQLGKALFDLPRLEGFLVPSAKTAGTNLIVFPEKLRRGTSSIRFTNPQTGKVEALKA